MFRTFRENRVCEYLSDKYGDDKNDVCVFIPSNLAERELGIILNLIVDDYRNGTHKFDPAALYKLLHLKT